MKWASLLDKHEKLLQEGTFEPQAFRVEAEPIAKALRDLAGGAGGINSMRPGKLEEFNQSRNRFEATLNSKGGPEDRAVYLELRAIWHKDADAKGDQAGNAAQNPPVE